MPQKYFASEYEWKLSAFGLGHEIKEHDLGFLDDKVKPFVLCAYDSHGILAGEYVIENMPGYQIETGYLDDDDLQLTPVAA